MLIYRRSGKAWNLPIIVPLTLTGGHLRVWSVALFKCVMFAPVQGVGLQQSVWRCGWQMEGWGQVDSFHLPPLGDVFIQSACPPPLWLHQCWSCTSSGTGRSTNEWAQRRLASTASTLRGFWWNSGILPSLGSWKSWWSCSSWMSWGQDGGWGQKARNVTQSGLLDWRPTWHHLPAVVSHGRLAVAGLLVGAAVIKKEISFSLWLTATPETRGSRCAFWWRALWRRLTSWLVWFFSYCRRYTVL